MDPGQPPVRASEFEAPAGWRTIDVLADLHLDEAHPATFEAWARHLRHTTADAVIILGDLFEAWVGDDARHDGLGRRALAVLREARGRIGLGLITGPVKCGMDHRSPLPSDSTRASPISSL